MSSENLPLFHTCDLSKITAENISTQTFFPLGIRWLHRGLEVTSAFQTKTKGKEKIKLHVQIYSEK